MSPRVSPASAIRALLVLASMPFVRGAIEYLEARDFLGTGDVGGKLGCSYMPSIRSEFTICCSGDCQFRGGRYNAFDGVCSYGGTACNEPAENQPSCGPDSLLLSSDQATAIEGDKCWISGCTWGTAIFDVECCACPAGYIKTNLDGATGDCNGRWRCVGCTKAYERLEQQESQAPQCRAFWCDTLKRAAPGLDAASSVLSLASAVCPFGGNWFDWTSLAASVTGVATTYADSGAPPSAKVAAAVTVVSTSKQVELAVGVKFAAGAALAAAAGPEYAAYCAGVGFTAGVYSITDLVINQLGGYTCPNYPSTPRRRDGRERQQRGSVPSANWDSGTTNRPRQRSNNPCTNLLALPHSSPDLATLQGLQDTCTVLANVNLADIGDAYVEQMLRQILQQCDVIDFALSAAFANFTAAVISFESYCGTNSSASPSNSSSSDIPTASGAATPSVSAATSTSKPSTSPPTIFTSSDSLQPSEVPTATSVGLASSISSTSSSSTTPSSSTAPSCTPLQINYGQCAGEMYSGPSACQQGWSCQVNATSGLHQCLELPGGDPTCPNLVWKQCGGVGWNSSTCCPKGSSCVIQANGFHQCLWNAPVSTSCQLASSTSSPPTTSRPCVPLQTNYGQCAGNVYTGPSRCQQGWACQNPPIDPKVSLSPGYQQCLPSNSSCPTAVWAQCGDNGQTGSTCCPMGASCVVQSNGFKQCLWNGERAEDCD